MVNSVVMTYVVLHVLERDPFEELRPPVVDSVDRTKDEHTLHQFLLTVEQGIHKSNHLQTLKNTQHLTTHDHTTTPLITITTHTSHHYTHISPLSPPHTPHHYHHHTHPTTITTCTPLTTITCTHPTTNTTTHLIPLSHHTSHHYHHTHLTTITNTHIPLPPPPHAHTSPLSPPYAPLTTCTHPTTITCRPITTITTTVIKSCGQAFDHMSLEFKEHFHGCIGVPQIPSYL